MIREDFISDILGRDPRWHKKTIESKREVEMSFQQILNETIESLSIDDIIYGILSEQQVHVPKWFKKWLSGLDPNSKKSMAGMLKGMSPEKRREFIATRGKEAAEKAGIEADKGMTDRTGREQVQSEPDKQREPRADGKEAERQLLGTSFKTDEVEEPGKVEEPAERSQDDKEPEEIKEPPMARTPENKKKYREISKNVDAMAAATVDSVSDLSADLQAFLNGEFTAGDLLTSAQKAFDDSDDLQRATAFLKRFAVATEAAKASVTPEIAKIIKRWSNLAQHGRAAGDGHTEMSSLPLLKRALVKSIANWKKSKRSPEAAFNMWEVAGELSSQMQAIAKQSKRIIDQSNGNENVRMRKSGMKTEVGKVEDGKQELDKGARILAAKVLKAADQPFKGLKPREAKAAVRKELERLIKDQHMFQRDIARMYGTHSTYVSKLARWSGAKVPTRGAKSAGFAAATSPERRMELIKGRRGELKPTDEKEIEGEKFGGGQDYYNKLWNKSLGKSGVDEEVGLRVLKRYKEEGRNLKPEDLAADMNVSVDDVKNFIASIPKNGIPKEELRRRLMVPVGGPSRSHRSFMETIEILDDDLIDEMVAVTNALNALIEITT